MPPLSSDSVGYEDAIEIQHHLVHLNADHHHHHHKSLVESINALLHVGGNGSQSEGGNSLDHSANEEDYSEDLFVVLFTLVPLVVAVALIFLIAVAIRKMRRSESLQEVVQKNEFKSSKKQKALRPTSSNALELLSSNFRKSKPKKIETPPSPISLKEIRVVQAPKREKRSLEMELSLESSTSFSSSGGTSCHTPTSPQSNSSLYFSQAPLWYLQATPYYRSQYHMNKLQRQLNYNFGSLQSFGSVQSLSHSNGSTESPSGALGHSSSMTTMTMSDGETDPGSPEKEKKKSSRKIKRVLQLMNFPKKIRQHQAEKNRFNIYDIPNETREQLKQIYVY